MQISPRLSMRDLDKASTLLAVTWISCSISGICVIGRFYSRTYMTHNLWWGDWVSSITMVGLGNLSSSNHRRCFPTIGFECSSSPYSSRFTPRKEVHARVAFMGHEQTIEISQLNWVSQTFCVFAMATGKVSVALLIGRLMGPSRWRKRFLYFLSITGLLGGGLLYQP